jgi:hypothetical protein
LQGMKQVTSLSRPAVPAIPAEKTAAAEPSPGKNQKEIQDERYATVNTILSKETFIDPLDPEQVTRSYAVYEKSPLKVVDVLIQHFRQYCRKCVREVGLLMVKNEVSQATLEEASRIRAQAIEEWNRKIMDDPILEQLLVMLLFKNKYWEWVRFGLKDIFTQQRSQPGHEINGILNVRFHRQKKAKGMKTVGDLVTSDITEIVNLFKGQIMEKRVRLFE